jgi:hypothetical protein
VGSQFRWRVPPEFVVLELLGKAYITIARHRPMRLATPVCALSCPGTYAHLDCRKRAAIDASDEVGWRHHQRIKHSSPDRVSRVGSRIYSNVYLISELV